MKSRNESAAHHTVVFTAVKKPGVPPRRMHVLYLLTDEGPKPLPEFMKYVIDTGHATAINWQKDSARAVGLFIDFLVANAKSIREAKSTIKPLALFAEALLHGTISQEGEDPSGLFWEPKGRGRARRILGRVTAFGDFMADHLGTANINPWNKATIGEQIAYWHRHDKRRSRQLLGYTQSAQQVQQQASKARSVRIAEPDLDFSLEPAKAFPQDKIGELLFNGFARRGKEDEDAIHKRLNIRNVLITILLHGAGFRESEPFQLYVSDVGVDPKNPNSAQVRLYHPHEGRAPADFIDPVTGRRIEATREQYLREKWKLEPRKAQEGRWHAGWKDLLLQDTREKCACAFWFPAFWGEIFLRLFKIYITHCRPMDCRHPFLFVSERQGYEGDAYTIDAFRQAHALAVARIGLVPQKDNGTTPHGHRHAYGQILAAAKVEPLFIQQAMHHKSPESQKVYTQLPRTKVLSALADAEKILNDGQGQPLTLPTILQGLGLTA